MAKINLPKPRRWRRRPEVLLACPIPLPMHGMAPRVVFGTNWWNRERLKAYKSTDYHCIACVVFKTDAKGKRWLEAHETYETDFLLGRMVYLGAVPLCHYCHNFCHPGRMRALLDANMMTHAKYAAIMQHGQAVLRAAKLVKPDYPASLLLNCDAGDWRLVVEGVEYDPKDYVKNHVRFGDSVKKGRKT